MTSTGSADVPDPAGERDADDLAGVLESAERILSAAFAEPVRMGEIERLTESRRRLLARLEAFVAVAEDTGRLPALRGTASRLLDGLRRSWPESESLPLYPAFRTESP
jgi:hypothetical protein